MMFPSPFYQYNYRYPYAPYRHRYNYNFPLDAKETSKEQTHENVKPKEEIKEEKRADEDTPIFNIFGISLYFDDLLLICLIFFLLQEEVTDEWLYLALILLLID